jgi:hypothetical protein
MSGGEQLGTPQEGLSELQLRYSLQQLLQIVEVLAPHLPGETLQEFTRITNEVIAHAAESAGIDPVQFTRE